MLLDNFLLYPVSFELPASSLLVSHEPLSLLVAQKLLLYLLL